MTTTARCRRLAAICVGLVLVVSTQAVAADTVPPSAPSGLTAAGVTQTSVNLTWQGSMDDVGVAGYRLYELVVINRFSARWTLRQTGIGSTATTVTGLATGSRHTYAVTAVDAAGNESARSTSIQVKTLEPPYILAGTAVLLAIQGTPFMLDVNALGNPAPVFSLIQPPAGMTIDPVTGIVQWTPAAPGEVAFTVRATNSEGIDEHVFTVYVDPIGTDREPPTWPLSGPMLQVTGVTADGGTLSWQAATDNSGGVAGYRILAQEAVHGASLFVAGQFAQTSGTITGLGPGTSYRLWVAAFDATGNQTTISGVTPTDLLTAAAGNRPPVADAGPDQTAPVGVVVLDGSGSSDPDGNPLTYSWTLVSGPAGSAATMFASSSVSAYFVMDKPGAYVAQLIVNDGSLDSVPDTVNISTSNSAPVANAGPDQTVAATAMVTLDGRASRDPDGTPVNYAWSFDSMPTGSMAALSNPAAAQPTFVADLAGTYVVRLVVNDGSLASNPATVRISTSNSAPVANAGLPQTVVVGTTVMLNGSGSSDPDGNSITYAWSVLASPGALPVLSGAATAYPSFVAGTPGGYVLQLIVNDGKLDSPASTVNITAITGNRPPIADAGSDQTVPVGGVTLDGRGSRDPDGSSLSYKWSFDSRPVGSTATLLSDTAVRPTFTADQPGTYVVRLVVNDGTFDSAPDTVSVTAYPPQGVDLDIAEFKVTTRTRPGQPISITLKVTNRGQTDEPRPATVTGMLNGVRLYNETMMVWGGAGITFEFPPYTPSAYGAIKWTATIADDNPDTDIARAVTSVKRSESEEERRR